MKEYEAGTARADRRMAANMAKRGDRGLFSRVAHKIPHALGFSAATNFGRKMEHVQNSDRATPQERQIAAHHLAFRRQSRIEAARLGKFGGAGDARTASNWNAGANFATGVSNTMVAAEAVEAGLAATGVGAVPAAIAAAPTELIRRGANGAKNFAVGRQVHALEAATAHALMAARDTDNKEERTFQVKSADYYDHRRHLAIPNTGENAAVTQSDLRVEILKDTYERGNALADVVRHGMAGKMKKIGKAASEYPHSNLIDWKTADEKKRGKAATDIQRVFRGHQGRKTAGEEKREKAATTIQALVRGSNVRKEIGEKNTAATDIQRVVRGYQGRGLANEVNRQKVGTERLAAKNQAATKIQKVLRGYRGRFEFAKEEHRVAHNELVRNNPSETLGAKANRLVFGHRSTFGQLLDASHDAGQAKGMREFAGAMTRVQEAVNNNLLQRAKKGTYTSPRVQDTLAFSRHVNRRNWSKQSGQASGSSI